MNPRKILLLVENILEKCTELKLSELMPKALTLSKIIDDKDFSKWLMLEISGYFETNTAFDSTSTVPNYRKIPGQYHDKSGRPLLIDDPQLFEVNNYFIREGLAEIEGISEKDKLLSVRNPTVMQFLKENLGVTVDTFTYNSNSLKSILSDVHTQLVDKLIGILKQIKSDLYKDNVDSNVPFELSSLHPLIQNVAGELYKGGHYRQAILDAYIQLVEAVKHKSGVFDKDNTPLMQTVFSANNPILEVSKNTDEQQGFMWLYSGATMGIRNPKAHRLVQQNDPQRTLEWLSFASVLLRVLDDSIIIKTEKK
jgi:uncharacterized protein (TIGR02391 family)